VIVGDHGWQDRNPEDKLSNLNAYHLPGESPPEPWPTIPPVDTFRVVSDGYFGGDFGTLEDRSYFSHEGDAFSFLEVVNTWSPVHQPKSAGCDGRLWRLGDGNRSFRA
jgi:hypothetical protein